MQPESNLPRKRHAYTPRRRTLLKLAGLTGIGTAAGVGISTSNAAGSGGDAAPFDVIVIGAGFAGVTAARELQASGKRTLLLEARDRIGGRTWTSTFQGHMVEMGGTWVDAKQSLIQAEIKRHGIRILEDPAPDSVIFRSSGQFKSFPLEEAFGRQGELFERLVAGSRDAFPQPEQPFVREDLVTELDKLTLQDRLQQLRLSAEEEDWITPVTAIEGGAARGGLADLCQTHALCGYSYMGYIGLNTFRPEGGMGPLLQAMLNSSSAELRLNSPVRSVHDTGSGVTVTTRAGKSYSASAVVVAVPVNVWKSIRFTPGLPVPHTTATQQTMSIATGQKFMMNVQGDVGRFVAQPPEGHPLLTAVPWAQTSNGLLMAGFSSSAQLDTRDVAQVQAALQTLAPAARVTAVKSARWGTEEFSQGAWSWMQQGHMSKLLRAVQQPHGRISFATSDIASGWGGFVEGAIERGFAAAEEASRAVAR
ncbi:NAD(P)/FAD-dependent oxidoreductase [Streptomyces sp. NPDC006645]|uniref:flavin monoamine oxidase family protein n=1 Tax=unclassified Streptomyces TaxID=2593676 RepID=UPI0033BA8576